MIIQALCDLYDRLERGTADGAAPLAPFGYGVQKVSFVVVLNKDGTLHAIEDARAEEEAGGGGNAKRKPKPRRVARSLVVPSVPGRTVAVEPGFLCDTTAYVLGLAAEAKPGVKAADPARVRRCFKAFRDRHLAAETGIDDDGFRAVCQFLRTWNPTDAPEHPFLTEVAGGFGVFQIRGREEYAHESEAVRAFWSERGAGSPGGEAEGEGDGAAEGHETAPSLVSGRVERLARLHEPAIKGVVGAQTSGAKLASFNCSAFESYGKTQTYNAPVGVRDAFRYCTALNHLLASQRHRARLGHTTVVFWTESPEAVELFGQTIGSGTAHDAAVLTRLGDVAARAHQGLPTDLGDLGTPFYVLGLAAPSKSRLAGRCKRHPSDGEGATAVTGRAKMVG